MFLYSNLYCNNHLKLGSYECKCSNGFKMSANNVCEDVDECAENICDANAVCSNTVGSFTCECKAGYQGDGLECNNVNECLINDGEFFLFLIFVLKII